MKKWLLAAVLVFVAVIAIALFMPLAKAPLQQTSVTPPPAMPLPLPQAQQAPAQPTAAATQAAADTAPAPADTVDPEQPLGSLDPAAIASLRESLAHGDDRAPPLGKSTPEPKPSEHDLESPENYAAFEGQQEHKMKVAFVQAVTAKIPELEKQIADARAAGLAPEQLAEGEEKLKRLKEMRDQMINEDPTLAKPADTTPVDNGHPQAPPGFEPPAGLTPQ